MPALKPTSYKARIIWLGHVPDRDASLRAHALEAVDATLDGFADEAHGGATRLSCARVTSQYPKGTVIRNTRQLSVVSAEELVETAVAMGMEEVDPVLIGASMVVEGIPDFTHIPPSSRLQGPSGACITIDMENRPCTLPAREIEREAAGFGNRYKAAAKGRRGVTGWIERAGRFAVGDVLTLHVPDQRAWTHLDDARR